MHTCNGLKKFGIEYIRDYRRMLLATSVTHTADMHHSEGNWHPAIICWQFLGKRFDKKQG